jgi:hypothetical protein
VEEKMISVNRGRVEIEGMLTDLVQDMVHILNGAYMGFVERYGKETTDEYFARIGKISTITDIEERDSQLFAFCCELTEMMLEDSPSSLGGKLKELVKGFLKEK